MDMQLLTFKQILLLCNLSTVTNECLLKKGVFLNCIVFQVLVTFTFSSARLYLLSYDTDCVCPCTFAFGNKHVLLEPLYSICLYSLRRDVVL